MRARELARRRVSAALALERSRIGFGTHSLSKSVDSLSVSVPLVALSSSLIGGHHFRTKQQSCAPTAAFFALLVLMVYVVFVACERARG